MSNPFRLQYLTRLIPRWLTASALLLFLSATYLHAVQQGSNAKNKQQQFESNWTEPTTGMRFRRISGGIFRIGDQFSEGDLDEKPNRRIILKSFYLGVTEVTQAQWKAIMGWNSSRFKGDDRPVEKVSWYNVQEFIEKLNALYGDKHNFRLPTEAEWEYACRERGRKVRYCNGMDQAKKSEIHYHDYKTKPVASFHPNSLGLYDMSGNVWEWTCSNYKDSYDGSEEQCTEQAYRYSLRGGSWSAISKWVRAATRADPNPAARAHNLGFRLAIDLPKRSSQGTQPPPSLLYMNPGRSNTCSPDPDEGTAEF